MCSRPPRPTSLSLNVLFVDDISVSVDSAGQEVSAILWLFATPRAKLCLVLNSTLMDAYAHNHCGWLFFGGGVHGDIAGHRFHSDP